MYILQILYSLVIFFKKFLGPSKINEIFGWLFKKYRFFYLDRIYDFDEKQTVTRLTIFLPGKGCEWAKKTGGCTMCAYWQPAQKIGKKFSEKDLLVLCKLSFLLSSYKKPNNLTIYNGGSFLNDKEISLESQYKIFEEISKQDSIKKVFIESRVEFIDPEKIIILKNKIKDKKLIIGIGLESQDDKIRNEIIKKGLSKRDYEKAIKTLKKIGVKSLTYVFLKPLGLSEKEAIKEAIETIKYALGVGTDEVALEIAYIQENTLMCQFFKEKRYRPPWLWSVIEIIKKTYNLGPIHIGGFEDEPPPVTLPTNCPICSEKIKKILQEYRETNNLDLFANIKCECYKNWKEEIR